MKRMVILIGKITLGISFVILLYLIALSKINTIFNITANTERLELTVSDNNNSSWNFNGVNILDVYGNYLHKNFAGSVVLSANSTIRIDRNASGPAFITIENRKSKTLCTIKSDADLSSKEIKANFIEFEVDSIVDKSTKGITHVLPIKGFVKLGGDTDYEINGESTAVLKEGTVSMQGVSSIRRNEYFRAGTEQLNLGDELVFRNNPIAIGFVLIGEKSGLEVSYRVEAREAVVIRPGYEKSGYKISATLLDKFLNDRSFQTLSLLTGAIIVLITLLTFGMDIFSFYQTVLNNKES
jgi:hypothetical protein